MTDTRVNNNPVYVIGERWNGAFLFGKCGRKISSREFLEDVPRHIQNKDIENTFPSSKECFFFISTYCKTKFYFI